jgi:hypothetical protein
MSARKGASAGAGTARHEADAVPCKHRGATINLPTEGLG